jgi:E3 ubiquitin-protein ligase SIAH1
LERVVDSIVCGPCPHVPYGCDDARLVYHARQEHILQCPHAPCYCPGNACGFVGSVTTLVEHLAAAHSWPCTAEPSADGSFGVDLRHGFNFLTAVRGGAKYLLLLDMASTRFVHIISAVWIRAVPAMASNSSAPATVDTTCDLELRLWDMRSQFQLQGTTPSNRLPDPNASFHRFFFPNYLGGSDKATLHVTAVISIHSS